MQACWPCAGKPLSGRWGRWRDAADITRLGARVFGATSRQQKNPLARVCSSIRLFRLPRADADQRSEAVRRLNVTVETNTTADPANRRVDMPRCGSFPNVIITNDAGFCR